MKRYLLQASLEYSFPILRPIQEEIRRRGDSVAWYLDSEALEALLESGEVQLKSIEQVLEYNPIAVITCVDSVYDIFPGVKVQVFHGYALNKRANSVDAHFKIRGLFDIYCTQGESSTPTFKELERKHKNFRVYQTGWSKSDIYFPLKEKVQSANKRPVVLYSTTFTKGITSTLIIDEFIEEMLQSQEWEWIFMFHPKMRDPKVLNRYKELTEKYPNASFASSSFDIEAMQRADIMLCDSSSIIIEFMFLDKPVVTFRNTQAGSHLLNVTQVDELLPSLEKAFTRPKELMESIHSYTKYHEAYRDGECSSRILDAIDSFIESDHQGLRRKPLNLVRRYKLRRKLKHFPLVDRFRKFFVRKK